MQRACAQAGWTEQEFWGQTLRYIYNVIRGLQRSDQVRFEAARIAGMIAMLPHMKRGAKLRPHDVMKFDWEQSARRLRITPADLERMKQFDLENPTFPTHLFQ